MIIKTKKYQLETQTFVKLGMESILKQTWWVWFIPVAIMLIPIFVEGALGWCIGIALTLSILYVLFWWIQFTGMTQMEQNKVLFEKLAYEIDSRQIMMKLNAKQGMPMGWDKITKVEKRKDAFVLYMSRVQFIHLPFRVFKNENDIRFMEAILKRKNFLAA
ncbi:YcxB family protein [Sediminitomix flava]|uniref:YcxB-like protein n=1 Tax=Sediminitomix flava TaxID=379075 RepID=A0A315Z6F6_SEDFL|nr:YcxB family protein [Sediminitomix flava]PWJ39111.1 YcxB-like protein [Sediminitomix flava]